jgi:FlaA1/EpsC-like NDP-sugar epimerase
MKEKMDLLFKNKVVAVTGGLGSIGAQIIHKILKYSPESVLLLDNRETELFYASEYSKDDRIQTFFCDIREKEQTKRILKNVDLVFHAAAMKHVVVCEKNPFESVKTNVIGTQNIIESCMENRIEKMILISTDKAVNPTNVMGATKLLAERLVSAMCNIRRKDDTKFGIVRFGNVLYSRGSVLEIWEKQLKMGEKIAITNPEMTRFFMDVAQSVDLIFTASNYAENGETFILKMPSVKIGVLTEAFLETMGYASNHCKSIGMRPGEKLYEELLLEDETGLILENDKFFLRLPLKIGDKGTSHYKQLGFNVSKCKEFRSDNPEYLMSKKSVKEVLKSYKSG